MVRKDLEGCLCGKRVPRVKEGTAVIFWCADEECIARERMAAEGEFLEDGARDGQVYRAHPRGRQS